MYNFRLGNIREVGESRVSFIISFRLGRLEFCARGAEGVREGAIEASP